MIHQLVYASVPAADLSHESVVDLLKHSRSANQRRMISGVLLYSHDRFFQVLEGYQSDLEDLYAKIEQDPRHHDSVLIGTREIDERMFGGWSMAFLAMADFAGDSEPGAGGRILDPSADPAEMQVEDVVKLLLSMQDICRA